MKTGRRAEKINARWKQTSKNNNQQTGKKKLYLHSMKPEKLYLNSVHIC